MYSDSEMSIGSLNSVPSTYTGFAQACKVLDRTVLKSP